MLQSCVCQYGTDVMWQKFKLCFICPKDLLLDIMRLVRMHFDTFLMFCLQQWGPPRSSLIKSTLAKTATDGAIWHWCAFTWSSNQISSEVLGFYLNYQFVQLFINSAHAATSRDSLYLLPHCFLDCRLKGLMAGFYSNVPVTINNSFGKWRIHRLNHYLHDFLASKPVIKLAIEGRMLKHS